MRRQSLCLCPLPRSIRTTIACLPRSRARTLSGLWPQLTPVTLALGDVLYEPGRAMAHLYFPITAVVSLIYTMVDGTTAEMGLVGNEGVVGIAQVWKRRRASVIG